MGSDMGSDEGFFENSSKIDLRFTLYNMEGKKILDSHLTETIDLSIYENGLYLLHIVNEATAEYLVQKVFLSN